MSSINKRFDAVVARKYTTRDGQEKTQWLNIGRAVEWDDGNTEIELTSVPVGAWWNGKIKLFVQKPKEQSAPPRQESRPAPSRQDHNDYIANGTGNKHGDASNGFVDSEIPFAPIPRRQLW